MHPKIEHPCTQIKIKNKIIKIIYIYIYIYIYNKYKDNIRDK